MHETTNATLSAIQRCEGGVAIVWCADLGRRAWLAKDVESLLPSEARPLRVTNVDDALRHPDRVALLVPQDEQEVVLDLEACRDLLNSPEHPRTWPVVVFLLRAASGEQLLYRSANSLWGWSAGATVDPDRLAEIDMEAERARFLDEVGETPEVWLRRWRRDELPQNIENVSRSYLAMLLERP